MIEELDDRWLLGLRGSPVAAVDLPRDGWPDLTVTLADGVVLTVSGPVLLTDGPAAAPGAAALPVEAADRIVGATVLSAVAFKSGSLRVVFSTGHHLNVRGAESTTRMRVRKPGAFCWSWHQGAGTMRILGPEDPGH